MIIFNKPNKIIVLFIVFSILFIVSGISCCTLSKRNAQFEQQIQAFADRSIPGSAMDLFNGIDLSGWSVHGVGAWSVKDGILSVKRGVGYLATRCNTFKHFELSLDIRISPRGNSGVFVRAAHPGFSLRPWPRGYEAQVDNHNQKNLTGSIYNIQKAIKQHAKDDEWFTMKIMAVEQSITIQVNDETAASITNAETSQGFIALQAHDPWSTVEFRNIRIRIPDELNTL